MSWLEKCQPPEIDDGLGEPAPQEDAMSAIEKLVVSRQKTIDTLTSEIAEYTKQHDGMAVGSAARAALASVIKVKEQRLARVRVELQGFKDALTDARQTEIPGTKRK